MIRKFRKKPVVIEAVQWDGSYECVVTLEEFFNQGPEADFTCRHHVC